MTQRPRRSPADAARGWLDRRANSRLLGRLAPNKEEARELAPIFAAAASAVGLSPLPPQERATLAMLRGLSVELPTGEGKTLVGAMAAAGLVARRRRVHVLTANDYLARRDATWMGPLFAALERSVGYVTADADPGARRAAYACDVVYVSVAEAGFDVLRDRLAVDAALRTGAVRDAVIIDEADAVLLDEARVPLVLAAEGALATNDAARDLAALASRLAPGLHYDRSPDHRTVHLTEAGLSEIEAAFPGSDLFDGDAELLVGVNAALHAEALLTRDVDYMVAGGRVWLISGSRGRVEKLQRWPDGLQAAVEAKESLTAEPRLEVLDQLVIGELVSMYDSVVGMSATLLGARTELEETYRMHVVQLPPATPCLRLDRPTLLFDSAEHRDTALVTEVREAHEEGRPVLVACRSVADSVRYGAVLATAGLPATVLNAANTDDEAAIVAEAGAPGRITVSTQLAGRGTDIRLPDASVAAGGLRVIGVGLFPSSRLEDQLRGRAGRQGDPGDSVFLASLDDDLIVRHAPDHRLPLDVTADGVVRDRRLADLSGHAQRIDEGQQQSLRRLSTRYANLLSAQRRAVLEQRDRALASEAFAVEVLRTADGDLMDDLGREIDAGHLAAACRLALLAAIDLRWSEHLAFAGEIREGIHLRALAKEDPLTEFERQVATAFESVVAETADDAVRLLAGASTADGLDLTFLGDRVPSATWAYTVTDNELGGELDRMAKALGRR